MGQILIVDDDPTLQDLLREILEEEGYHVLQAAEGNAALDTLRRSPHRLVVLLDYLMPGMGGKGLLQVVSRDATLSTRHAYILLTARLRISRPVLETATTLRMPVVRKPFDLDALLATVAEAQQRLAGVRYTPSLLIWTSLALCSICGAPGMGQRAGLVSNLLRVRLFCLFARPAHRSAI